MSWLQEKIASWVERCFGPRLAADITERNQRFLEESLEFVQSTGMTIGEAYQLVDYVFAREVGDPPQEAGGVYTTLVALCTAVNIDIELAANVELKRIESKVDRIREKQMLKPRFDESTVSPKVELYRYLYSGHNDKASLEDARNFLKLQTYTIDALRAEAHKWRAAHNSMVARNAVLRQRPDLPVDRLPAMDQLHSALQMEHAFAQEEQLKRIADLETQVNRLKHELSRARVDAVRK